MAKAVNIERSHRLDGIGEYYFSRRLREIADIEAATGRQIVKLAMGSPDLPPHQSVIDRLAKEAQRPDVHKYMSYKGEPILRKAFADWYKKWYGVEFDYNSEILPLIGSKEGIMHICMTFLNPGDKVLVPNPGYPTYSAAVRLSGGEMLPYALNKQTNFYPDFEAIERAGLDGVKMMLVNYPNMPTGQTPTRELFEKIIEFGAKHNILIVHDNPYSFIRNSDKPMSIMSVDGAREVALEMNSLSKGHSMAGWRVGVILGRKEWIDSILTFKSNMDSGMFYPIQAAADTALSLGADWYKQLNDIYYVPEIFFAPAISVNTFAKSNSLLYPRWDAAQFQKLCLTFEVDPGYRFDKLSHGQQKKALIAFALALNTRILLMDEPSNGLDIPSKTTLRRVISECATEERIIAISTHQVRDLENLIDPVIILDRSGLILNASIEQISEKLLFTMSQELDPEAYWSESSLSGYYQVIPNREGMPSRVNLEALFNAALRNKETFKTLFR